MKKALPAGALRLFGHYDRIDPQDPGATGLILARLLEEGNSKDLSWLTSMFSETGLAEWFDRHGDRQLSRRSRSFWQRVLNRADSADADSGDDLWPL